MAIHHLNCGTLCPRGGRLLGADGGWLAEAPVVCHCLLVETSDGLVLVDTGFGTGDARVELAHMIEPGRGRTDNAR